jgi:hypothetical protein
MARSAPAQTISPRSNPRAEALTPVLPRWIIAFPVVEPRAMWMPISRVLCTTARSSSRCCALRKRCCTAALSGVIQWFPTFSYPVAAVRPVRVIQPPGPIRSLQMPLQTAWPQHQVVPAGIIPDLYSSNQKSEIAGASRYDLENRTEIALCG